MRAGAAGAEWTLLQKDAGDGNDTHADNNYRSHYCRLEELGEKSNAIFAAWLERYVPMLVHCCGNGLRKTNK